jgi:hypothetical protein
LDTVIGDLKQEIKVGSVATSQPDGTTVYIPTSGHPEYMVPVRSGTSTSLPNLVRRSFGSPSPEPIPPPGQPSRASAVSSAPLDPANPKRGDVIKARWNTHYLLPKLTTGDDGTEPIAAFTAPDWVFVTNQGPAVITTPSSLVLGRYAYAVYDEGGLLDMNVAGYPTDPSAAPVPAQRVGRKGSLAYADLTALGNYPISNGPPPVGAAYQMDKIVGWRNYATTQPTNKFPDSNFAANFQSDSTGAAAYFTSIISNTTGFLTAGTATWNNRTDQMLVQRQELIGFRSAVSSSTSFSANALQYLSTFARESNGPTFSPSTPTTINPNFLLTRVPSPTPAPSFTRFDGTTAVGGEPLVKTRFPLSRIAWITYKGPSATRTLPPQTPALATTDPNYDMWALQWVYGIPASYLQQGTAGNIKTCFGLAWDSRTPYVAATQNTNSTGLQWVYTSPSSANTGGNFDPTSGTGNPASDIKTLATVASEGREPDFFELLRATILEASLGQNTSNGTTSGVTSSAADAQGANTFPDLHMSNKALHVLTIGASVIDQFDIDSMPTRIQLKPSGASVWWTGYGVESLPYLTEMYPIAGKSPSASNWATYLLFQLWNPHIAAASPTPNPPQVRIHADGNIGLFSDRGAGLTWTTTNTKATFTPPPGGMTIALTSGAFAPGSTPAPLSTPPVAATAPAVGSQTLPGFEVLPSPLNPPGIQQYIGLRLPNFTLNNGPVRPVLNLYLGTDSTHQFNVTMEYTPDSGTSWVPYNHFIGTIDRNSTIGVVTGSWINGATLPVRQAPATNGNPNNTTDQFNVARLTDGNEADCLMKADPRATRFGIFQFDRTTAATEPRLTDSLWPTGRSALPNGYGGTTANPDGSAQVKHAPLRFSGAAYYPATFSINSSTTDARDTATSTYADNDNVTRPADGIYPGAASQTGQSTPYFTTSTSYHPIMLNRPFRNVAELGYAFRDLPWKSLDFFTDKSADAGLLDIFCIHDGPRSTTSYNNGTDFGNAVPTIVAGKVNVNSVYLDPNNSALAPVGQPILAGAGWDEITPSSTVAPTGSGDQTAQTMTSRLANATRTTSMQNKSELITRVDPNTGAKLVETILPPASNDKQSVKAQREVVARGVSSVAQTRVWNLLIDMVAQSGHFKPGAASLPNDFVVEGEKHYWVHVAIDRFTGQVIDKQVEEVQE